MKKLADFQELLERIFFPKYRFLVGQDGERLFLQAEYLDRDIYTKTIEVQKTRKWWLSPHMTDSEFVQTCLKCVLTSAEHRVREHFLYRRQRVFGPHFDVEDLVRLCEVGLDNAGGRR